MSKCLRLSISSFWALLLFVSFSTTAAEYLVKDQHEFRQTLSKLVAGDTLVLANGTWENFEIKFEAEGSEEAPIILTAETKGKVFLTGQSNLQIAGQHLVVSGLVFRDGFTPTSSVISYRTSKNNVANYVRVTEVVIDNYSNPDRFETDYWVAMYGRHNRLDHSFFEGKRNRGVTLAVRLDSELSQENYHRIDHNYFGPRPVFGSNGGETVRIGTSHYSLSSSYTRVENNLFDRCNGEVEIISVKSGNNQILNNTFLESRGTLTLRHGNNNLVKGNVFIGNQVANTGGVRVINKGQEVTENVFSGLTGYRFGSGFTVMNGVPNSPINRYHQVTDAKIHHNTFFNVDHIQLAAGADDERSAPPQDSLFTNNLIVNTSAGDLFSFYDDISGISFANNIANHPVPSAISQGFSVHELKVTSRAIPAPQKLGDEMVGAPAYVQPIAANDVGPSWYPKGMNETGFDTGNTIYVQAGDDSLFNAVQGANAGDTLILADGVYLESKIIPITQYLTIRSMNTLGAQVLPLRSSLFELQNGGSLKLLDLVLSGKNAPDSSGNTLIRTQKWGMYKDYRLVLDKVKVDDLDVNHSFHFFTAGARSFANRISIRNSEFSNISGDILKLNKETDDLGIYNVEFLELEANSFTNIAGAVALVYRGGTDESTFGPQVTVKANRFTDVGQGKRNKSGASLLFHGTQLTLVTNNQFMDSAPIKMELTVGEPQFILKNNQLDNTPNPVVFNILTGKVENRRVSLDTSALPQEAL
jgi:poly(beta-D-mannuronate) lyase